MSVTPHYDKPEDAGRLFAALSEKGTVTIPIGETFWAKRFGTFVDRFGTPLDDQLLQADVTACASVADGASLPAGRPFI